jgi:hypothetical protein
MDPLGPNPIPFTRSNFMIGVSNAREQINEITAFIDASVVYGSDAGRAAALRTNGGLGAKLITSAGDLPGFNGGGLPNENNGPLPDSSLFLAGDIRANENVGLSSLQTVFLREHNRLVDIIATEQPMLSDEDQFQLARKIVGAEIQIVTYNEFLPALLGEAVAPAAADYFYVSGFPPDITQAFAHASYRYGHSTVSEQLVMVNDDNSTAGSVLLRDVFFNPTFLTNDPDNVDLILKGAASQVSQEVDVLIVDALRNFLFGPPGAGGMDLAALNIQRGRDHGLVDYNELREGYEVGTYSSFSQITSDATLAQTLDTLYEGDIDNVDSWIGGLAEDHLPGSSLGELFSFIIANQFERLRDGDRLFYLSDDLGLYTGGVLNSEIASMIDLDTITLSDIIEMNTSLTSLQDNVFFTDVIADFDADGDYGAYDVDALVAEIVAGTNDPAFDVTGDGVVDAADLQEWLAEAGAFELVSGNPYQPADANLDGTVNELDFFSWNANKFTSDAGFSGGDFNADGVVDGYDLLIWNEFKFTSADDGGSIPEPNSMTILLLGAALVWRRQKRYRGHYSESL